MATVLQMSQEPLAGYRIGSPPPRGRYPAASLSEVASAALANVGTSSSSSNSSQSPQREQLTAHPIAAPGSSNGSQRSWATDDTSPKSAQSARKQTDLPVAQIQRLYTPERQIIGTDHISTSPVLDVSVQMKQGAKRTASGSVKTTGQGYAQADLGGFRPVRGHARAKSMSKAAEISLALKTRLAYAMVKINHGWENHSLDQLEQFSRVATPSVASPSATSPRRRRFSVHSEHNDHYVTSPDMQRSPGQYSPGFVQQPYSRYSPPVVSNSGQAFSATSGPSLAPAAPIAAGRSHRRSQSAKGPPTLTTRGLDAYSQPVTPQRQGILRMPSQQAEKDALDSLLFMASPNNSSNFKYTDSPAGPSPLRSEFPTSVKRVVFEN